jgi:uncharacterized protein YkwD
MAALSIVGCAAALEANRRSPGTLTDGGFQPGRPAATQVGPDASRTCPRNPSLELVSQDLSAKAKSAGTPAPQVDGRLCATAETLLGWQEPGNPPQSVVRFLAGYFGLESPNPRVNIATFETEDARQIADRLGDALASASSGKVPLRFGMVTLRVKKGVTKTVLVTQEAPVELDPVPRKLTPGSKAQVSGKLVPPFGSPRVSVSDAAGHLTASKPGSGEDFKAEIACGDKPGRIGVEIRGAQDGEERILASFPVACGTDLPTSVAVAKAASGTGDAASNERALFDQVNAERKAAGLPALEWDDAVGKVARSLAEQYRESTAQGAPLKADVNGMLREAGVSTAVVLVNPAAATSAAEAQASFDASPTNRANLLNPEITHSGVGIVTGKDKQGRVLSYVIEVFVKEAGKLDAAESLKTLRAAIAQKRAAAGASALSSDATLDKAAQRFATALAAAGGKLDKATDDKIIKPLYRSYSTLNVLAGAKADVVEFASEEGVRGPGKVIGVGLAQGTSESLGKDAVYGVILIGVRSAKQGPK